MAAPAPLKLGAIVEGHTYMGGDPNNQASWMNVDDLANSGLSGDELLGQLQKTNPSMVPIIKSMSEGRYPVPANRVATDPYWQTLFQVANQYDPSLDAVNYPARQKVRSAFTSGTPAANIRNLNQAIGHLHELTQAIPKVAGHSGFLGLGTLLNAGENAYESGNGDPGITAYNVPRTALSGEAAAVFKGTGTSAENEVNKWYNALDINSSTAQKQEAARQLTSLFKSRLDELGQQYNEGMGTTKDGLDFLNPVAQKQFNEIQTLGLDPNKAAAVNNAATGIDPQTQTLLKKYGVTK